jgi:putative membrane-bound dehydrogenase-like protein
MALQDGSEVTVNRMRKTVRDHLKTLADTDGDGVFDTATVVMDDLEIPSSILLDDGWIYLSSLGSVVRHRQPAAGGPYDTREEIIRGLCGFHHHQASGMTLSHDRWLFVTAGDDDNHGEGADGTRATILRCGAIVRSRPDGTELSEFARGFRNPYRNVVFDDYFNIFHIDNDQEDGSKFQGCRLMNVQEAADYGWRLAQGTICCRTDFARGAVFGEAPGKMPSMLKTGRGAPAGLLIYQGTHFPDFFRGLLIYPDVYRKLVRAYAVERAGSTFRVTSQFVLMQSNDPLFRPCQALAGPDGAIYILDWRTDSGGAGRLWGDGEHGRIYRLSWSGTADAPAIPMAPMDTWSRVATADDDQLWDLLDSPDFDIRTRAQKQLVSRGAQLLPRFVQVALDDSRTGPARAVAIGAASQFYDNSVEAAMLTLLEQSHDFELRRLAADAISRHTMSERANVRLIARLATALEDPEPAVRRAVALAMGRVASLLSETSPNRRQTAEFLLAAYRNSDPDDKYLHDGVLRGLERTGDAGVGLLVELARSDDAADRELAIGAIEALRTAPAATGLDALLQSTDRLSDGQTARVLATYRHLLIEPPVDGRTLARWLVEHGDAPSDVQLVGLESLALLGTVDPEKTLPIVNNLLAHPDLQTRLAVIDLVGLNHLVGLAPALAGIAADTSRDEQERRVAITTLDQLRQVELPWDYSTPPGVELVVDDLLAIAADRQSVALRADIVRVVAGVDFAKASGLAEELLESDSSDNVAAAVGVLSADRAQAIRLAELFLAGRLDASLLAVVSDGLRRHAEDDADGRIAELLRQAYADGLALSLDPAEVARLEKQVSLAGDAEAGKALFLDARRTQCATCHRLEGVGGQVGPDLSKIWETHSVAKILESIVTPSKEIKEGFQTYTVVSSDGRVFTGLKIADTDREVVLRDAQGNDVRINQSDVEEIVATKTSLMPEGVIAQLSYTEAINLVAFLRDRAAQESLRAIDGDASVPLAPPVQ